MKRCWPVSSKYRKIIGKIISKYKKDPKVLCILLYGSVARGTAHKNSDIDIEIFRKGGRTYNIKTKIEGIKVDLYIYPVNKILKNVKKHPFLAYPYLEEKILFEREYFATKLINSIKKYFNKNKDIKNFWFIWTKDYLEKKKNNGKIENVDKFYKSVNKRFSNNRKIELPF